MTVGRCVLAAALAACVAGVNSVRAAIPTPDHVVIVIEENHSADAVLGNATAPYINGLAGQGQSFTKFFGISHPSQPNYLQLFSGQSQGVIDDALPAGTPFTTPNLGAALPGKSFTGFSEDLPAVGDNSISSGNYVRRHNPWVNWQNDVAPSAYQLPSTTNQPFTAFPTSAAGFSLLPKVSVVVPNLQDDMHDGTIAQADTWLSNNLESYRYWAMNNNSLLIVTWDEDDHTENNQIPTIFVGPMVRTGATVAAAQNWNLHNLLRTVGDLYGAAPAGSAANVAPITGIWKNETVQSGVTKTFQQGVGGYASAHDTYVESANPTVAHSTGTIAVADGSPQTQALIRFDNLIGSGAGQVPAGSQILRAQVTFTTGTTANDQSAATMSLHRMLKAWVDGDTWASLVGGVSTDGVEAAAIADNALTPELLGNSITFDVTGSLQAWANGAPNNGWLVNPFGTDGWRWDTSDFATSTLRPKLEVTYLPEPTGVFVAAAAAGCASLARRRR
jgi:hypothetical protein